MGSIGSINKPSKGFLVAAIQMPVPIINSRADIDKQVKEIVRTLHATKAGYPGAELANEKSISYSQLAKYPCLSFEQGDKSSFYLSEEILSTNEYSRTVKASDRATMLNLMVGLNGYTLCSGIICEELNGSDYLAIPFEGDEQNQNSDMEIGYITRKNSILSKVGNLYVSSLKKYLEQNTVSVE